MTYSGSVTAEPTPILTVGGDDRELDERLDRELAAFNEAAIGAPYGDSFSVKVVDDDGELVGGLTAYTWGALCLISLLWVREDGRAHGWGAKILKAAELEAGRRGCDRVIVSTYTFQAPGFYQRQGYAEISRVPGIPGGHEDVYLLKRLEA
ncbi:GNAT family N-acetyltransferase [Spongiactinospora gelatinilytica]|uniref:GNAT family N-acetyltransferase n=1 Tax=Spongiactinospora gelatinilytica TaxID=2666298 RepID=A0A2W2I7Q2_9ACTN|nr:GNAT family N-acetyltransferase [Spongiactinospora gelatinilytica]